MDIHGNGLRCMSSYLFPKKKHTTKRLQGLWSPSIFHQKLSCTVTYANGFGRNIRKKGDSNRHIPHIFCAILIIIFITAFTMHIYIYINPSFKVEMRREKENSKFQPWWRTSTLSRSDKEPLSIQCQKVGMRCQTLP